MNRLFLLVISLVALSFPSCNCNQQKIKKEAEKIVVPIKVVRFEKELFSIDKKNFSQGLTKLQIKYPRFYQLFTRRILQLDNSNDSSAAEHMLYGFVNHPSLINLYDTVEHVYADFSVTEKSLVSAMQYHQYYFPKTPVPAVYTFISEFSYGIVTDDSLLGIGLDLFLGKDYPYYPSLGLPNFIIRKCTPEYVTVNAMKGYVQYLYPINENKHELLEHIIYNGKVLYYLDHVMPDAPDSMKIGWKNTDLQWCLASEYNIWDYFISKKLLYNTDALLYSKYINDSPVTAGMPPGAPGNIGSWLGWQIVKKYMDENKSVTLQQLMKETDSQKILNESHYKPKR